MNRRRVQWGIAVALASLSWTTSRTADACTGPAGFACRGAHADAAPANAQAIAFRSVYALGTPPSRLVWSTQEPAVQVKDASDAPVAVTVSADPNVAGRWLVRPAAPLAAGAKYKVQWQPLCSAEESQSLTGLADPTEAEIVVPNAAPMPTALGTAVIDGAPQRRPHVMTGCDSAETAGKTFDEVRAHVRLDQDPSFAPYAAVATVKMTLDGVTLDEPPLEYRYTDGFGGLIASCDAAVDTGVSPGVHKVGFRAFVIGMEAPLTAETTVDFSCARANEGPGENEGAAGGSGTPAGGSANSCALTTTTERPAFASGALALVASCLIARRRRARAQAS